MKEPRWLTRRMADAFHDQEVLTHGGLAGVRDDDAIESALSRPQNKWAYEPDVDLYTLAAAYGFGLAKNHGYLDGNKRIAFTAMDVFLGLNGYRLNAPEAEAVITMLGAASGEMSETDLAAWCRENNEPRT